MSKTPADGIAVTHNSVSGVHRPRARSRGLVGPAGGLLLSGTLAVLLFAAAAPQFAAAVGQTGRPGVDATVLACPGPGGTGPACTVSVPRDGHSVALPLDHARWLFPEPGDAVRVVVDEADRAAPAGWAPWLAAGALLALGLIMLGSAVRWGRTVLSRAVAELSEYADSGAGSRAARPYDVRGVDPYHVRGVDPYDARGVDPYDVRGDDPRDRPGRHSAA
ncbi:MAG: hypothetical protein KDB39_18050 [Austwickia sp.]|nr:hypothetical protein [Actinomycetota bacterium]MCB1255100.1 hypothetical protein [Austwickia sp.]